MKKFFLLVFLTSLSVAVFSQADTTGSDDDVFVVVQNEPQFPGGMGALFEFISYQIKYPAAAQEAQMEGKVYVQFIIERDGAVSNVKVLRGLGYGLDQEAIRVVQLMPRWSPGSDGSGKPVRVRYNLPIVFKLP